MSKLRFNLRRTLFTTGLAAALAALAALWTRPAIPLAPTDQAALLRAAIWVPAATHTLGSREPDTRPPRTVSLPAYGIWPTEISHAWWRQFQPESPPGSPDLPATGLSHHDATAFCTWASQHYGLTIRLPTADEWEAAARDGHPGIPYAWGWGEPVGRAVFNTDSPQPVRSGPPHLRGLYHMSGNVAEWCADPDPDTAPALGGSWSERAPEFLRLAHHLHLPKTYHGRDTGFRIVIEPPPAYHHLTTNTLPGSTESDRTFHSPQNILISAEQHFLARLASALLKKKGLDEAPVLIVSGDTRPQSDITLLLSIAPTPSWIHSRPIRFNF
jgi:formylglycine-generating enzyme required for sulfatase activity